MDLKYNLALALLLGDRSPLPITTLEVIKDSPEFVTLASSLHVKCSIPPPPPQPVMHLKGNSCVGINYGFNRFTVKSSIISVCLNNLSLCLGHKPFPVFEAFGSIILAVVHICVTHVKSHTGYFRLIQHRQ